MVGQKEPAYQLIPAEIASLRTRQAIAQLVRLPVPVRYPGLQIADLSDPDMHRLLLAGKKYRGAQRAPRSRSTSRRSESLSETGGPSRFFTGPANTLSIFDNFSQAACAGDSIHARLKPCKTNREREAATIGGLLAWTGPRSWQRYLPYCSPKAEAHRCGPLFIASCTIALVRARPPLNSQTNDHNGRAICMADLPRKDPVTVELSTGQFPGPGGMHPLRHATAASCRLSPTLAYANPQWREYPSALPVWSEGPPLETA